MEEINLGSQVCAQLKNIYFNEVAWIDCHKEISFKFTALKDQMRKLYPDMTNLCLIREILRM